MGHVLRRVVCAGILWGVFAGAMPSSARADGQLWLISTRQAPSCNHVDSEALGYWRLDGCQWTPSDLTSFLAADNPAIPTVFFVHGNDNDEERAVDVANQIYQHLLCVANGRPFRMVIWSWPSDKVTRRLRQDTQIKAARSDDESFYLAAVIDRMNPAVRVSLSGYSFGSRVVSGALELLAGGSINCQALPRTSTACRVPMRAVLIAAGMDADWLMPGHRNGMALTPVEHMLITTNQADPVLKHYGLMYHIHGPLGMGYSGPLGTSCMGEQAEKLDAINITCEVGHKHRWEYYFSSGTLRCKLGWYAFLEEPDLPASPTPAKPEAAAAAVDEELALGC